MPKSYSEYYGIKANTRLGRFVTHLRSAHRVKYGTDYWILKNKLGVIVRPLYEDDINFHLMMCDIKGMSVRVKDKPGKKDNVFTHEDDL